MLLNFTLSYLQHIVHFLLVYTTGFCSQSESKEHWWNDWGFTQRCYWHCYHGAVGNISSLWLEGNSWLVLVWISLVGLAQYGLPWSDEIGCLPWTPGLTLMEQNTLFFRLILAGVFFKTTWMIIAPSIAHRGNEVEVVALQGCRVELEKW